jgi:hypothetical protein
MTARHQSRAYPSLRLHLVASMVSRSSAVAISFVLLVSLRHARRQVSDAIAWNEPGESLHTTPSWGGARAGRR